MQHSEKEVIILGTGGNCLDIVDTIRDINDAASKAVYKCVGFLDDDEATWGRRVLGVPVLGALTLAHEYSTASFVNGIGSTRNFWRKPEILATVGVAPERWETIIHPTASVSRTARLGEGCVVFQNVTITTNVTVGSHVVVLPNSVLSHDDVVGDFSTIAGGVCLSGGVTIGRCCYVGSRAVVRESVTVGDYALIGMGSVVLHDVPDRAVVAGCPAKWLRNSF